MKPLPSPDLLVQWHGSVTTLVPVTDVGREWIDRLCAEPWQYMGAAVVVDSRLAPDLVEHAIEDGLTV